MIADGNLDGPIILIDFEGAIEKQPVVGGELDLTPTSRTTDWCKRKSLAVKDPIITPVDGKRARKAYCCSKSIFEWDLGDVATTKEGELKKAGVSKPSTAAVNKANTKFELARHCRRRTRGEQETIRLIESLFLNAEYLTDFLGTPLLKEDAFEIWQEEQCHVKCLQDPVNAMLYTQTGTISKGGISLPVYRCARGTTSLESFHAHQAPLLMTFTFKHIY
ncbi:hypothetical protein DAPPUDRAFT_341760 [Daphnia pulex]|uniref:Uncharacterized protein n=1 Tax=Daphnia pulex TaxID=6669 RepID=E9I5J9_DAPPU|nr:hypothetical protein DAPPUDRAFT_341760 [Daphnia pulex]|eukprot:EFX60730.1 hypothetical protein DAPPUDRAFT_341760 [Daphnia pulex]